jgi:hypothetical protein
MKSEPYQFQVGDYVRFTRIVHPKKACGFKPGPGGRAIATPEIPEQILQQSGEGELLSIAKTPKKVQGEKVRTGRVASTAGVVSAILDDATLTALPMRMDLGVEATDPQAPNIYSTDAKSVS